MSYKTQCFHVSNYLYYPVYTMGCYHVVIMGDNEKLIVNTRHFKHIVLTYILTKEINSIKSLQNYQNCDSVFS